MKVLKAILWVLIAILLIWVSASYIEILCKNLTSQNYSDFNIIIWAMNYRP